MNGRPDQLSREEQRYAIRTWRYLRLAMVALVVGLAVSILYEWSKVDFDCFQTSISAYYYTPVRGFFVGALMSIGICLFCLSASNEREDTLLNLAGMFALVVALVPTPGTGSCASLLGTTQGRDLNVANNVTALIAVGAVALVILLVLARRSPPTRTERVGFLIAALVWAVTALVFWLDRDFFISKAHYTAAVLMFVCILIVVWTNAAEYPQADTRSPRNPYTAVAIAMVAAAVVIGLAGLIGWDHWVLAIEAAWISLFAVFWVIQTRELWHEGLR